MKKHLFEILIATGALVVIGVIILLRLTVFTPLRIETGSMTPTLPIGTVIIVQPSESFKAGDIITFQQESMSRPVTHSFIGYAADGSLNTKGDANEAPDVRDVPLQQSDVIGKVVFAILPLISDQGVSMRGALALAIAVLAIIAIAVVRLRARKELQLEKEREEALALNPVVPH